MTRSISYLKKLASPVQKTELYPFDHRKALDKSTEDGICGPLTTLFIRKLLSQTSIGPFVNPQYKALNEQSKIIADKMVALERDGNDGDNLAFIEQGVAFNTSVSTVSGIKPLVHNVDAALLKFRVKSGVNHQIAFGKYASQCVLFDPNKGVLMQKCEAAQQQLEEILSKTAVGPIKVTSYTR